MRTGERGDLDPARSTTPASIPSGEPSSPIRCRRAPPTCPARSGTRRAGRPDCSAPRPTPPATTRRTGIPTHRRLTFRVGSRRRRARRRDDGHRTGPDGSHQLTITFRTTRRRRSGAPRSTTVAHAHGEGRELDDPFGPLRDRRRGPRRHRHPPAHPTRRRRPRPLRRASTSIEPTTTTSTSTTAPTTSTSAPRQPNPAGRHPRPARDRRARRLPPARAACPGPACRSPCSSWPGAPASVPVRWPSRPRRRRRVT